MRIRPMIGLAMVVLLASSAAAAEYQWSVAVAPAADQGNRPVSRAYLWIAPECQRVRAVVVGQHNMLEEDILEDAGFRAAMGKLGVAIVWISPAMDGPFDPARSGARFEAMMQELAAVSGYGEVAVAPIAPIGHSACASYPWNFAAWAPQRTLGVMSIHGDAPQTPLAGYGRPNPSWGERTIDGVPGVMVMAEYEWVDARWAPASVYKVAHPKTPIAFLAEPGEGHFAACEDLVRFLEMFVRKCVEQRLPPEGGDDTSLDKPPVLRPVDPAKGWLVQRWTLREARTVPPGPAAGGYLGDGVDAFWAFDEEMARAIQEYHADQIGKLPQLVGFVQNGQLVPATNSHPMVTLKFLPGEDGETFALQTTFLEKVTSMGVKLDGPGRNNHVRWTGLPAGSPLGHATGGGPIQLHRIEGPVEQIGPETFRLSFYRGASMDRPAIWLCATHPGDERYKRAVQQALINLPRNTRGQEQVITFPEVADVAAGGGGAGAVGKVKLAATSSAGLPVHYYVREGPAEVKGDTLTVLPIPPRTKFPVKVTVVAWQWGRPSAVQTAAPVERTFAITR